MNAKHPTHDEITAAIAKSVMLQVSASSSADRLIAVAGRELVEAFARNIIGNLSYAVASIVEDATGKEIE